jgi:ABC-type branched-subunit amino acid transport system substrate-binding protein
LAAGSGAATGNGLAGAGSAGAGADPSAAGGSGAAGPGAGGSALTSGRGSGPAGAGATARNASTGGATDVGVSPTEIHLGWVGTLTGPMPGLFRGALVGTQAWANYQNSQGGLMGRKLTVASGDDALDSGRNRASYLQLKDKVFSFVGSFSINDDGGASVINACSCPDITGNLGQQMNSSPYHYGPIPQPLGWRSGPPRYYAQQQGSPVITKAAFFYAQVGAAVAIAQEQRRVYEANGFKFVYSRGIPPNDNNQTADVVQMRQAGVRAVVFQADLTSITKLVNAMRQQSFNVDLLNLGNTMYDSTTFKVTTGAALKGMQVDQPYALFLGEDAGRIPEVALFNEWMKKTDPNQTVDLFSMYGWLSGRLFADAMNKMTAAGKTPVRKDLIDTLKGWGTWEGYGMVAPVTIGQKRPSDCFFIFTATADGKFQRTLPTGANNYECGIGPFSYKP